MGASEEMQASLLRRSYLVRNIGAVVGVVGIVLAFAHSGDRRSALMLGFGTFAATLVMIGAKGTLRRVRALASPVGIRVGEKLVARRETIRGAWIEHTLDAPIVHLDRRLYPDVELEAPDEPGARALCQVLFGGSAQGLLRFKDRSMRAWRIFQVVFLTQILAHCLLVRDLSPRHWIAVAVLSAMFVASLCICGIRRAIAIGADGVLVSGILAASFVGFRDIESVVAEESGWPSSCKLVITARRPRPMVFWMRAIEARAAADRVQAAIGATDGIAEPVRMHLRRGGPDVRAWLARLRTLTHHREPYRAIGAPVDTLWRLMDDPTVGESERAAAAVVLGADASNEARSRLRDVAARVASPRVRVAIERVAEGAQEDDLARAMAAVDDSHA
jgi:hypothetical protein